jgi:regulator of protease activity HflC (stomatin/prohibitin superfamily)
MARYDDLLDEEPQAPSKRGLRSFVWRHLPAVTTGVLVGLLMIVVLWPYVVITVPSGRVGVYWKRFHGFDFYCWCFVGRGTILDPRELREEGLHIIAPWDKLFIYDLRLQAANQTINAISKDGVNVTAQINIRYQLAHRAVAVLHKFIGPHYLDTVIGPEIGSQAREVISKYTAEEVYTSRDAIQEQIRNSTQKSLGANLNRLVQPEAMEQPDPKHYNDFLQGSIQILDTLVLSIDLPAAIVNAINRQTEQFYLIQEYRFRVEREAEESKRKQIEANGIAAFQQTVSKGISDSYLRWRGIEATLLLAQSQNTKIVIIGSGKDGLPIILNAETATPGVTSPPGGNGGQSSPPGGNGGQSPPPPPPTPNAPEPNTAPGGSSEWAPPAKSSNVSMPPASDKIPAAQPPGGPTPVGAPAAQPPGGPSPVGTPTAPAAPSRGEASAVESILSRINGALHEMLPPPPPAVPEEVPKH